MTGVLIKGRCGQTQRHAQEGRRVRTEPEPEVMCLQAEEHQGLHTSPRTGRPGTVVPYNLQGDHDPAQTLILNFQPSAS